MRRSLSPLWRCSKCARTFANRNQRHTCKPLGSLSTHFEGKSPAIRALYDRFVEVLEQFGSVDVLPEKTRIAFHVRMSFAVVMPRQQWLDGHLVLARRVDSPRFRRVETFSLRNHVHAFRLSRIEDIDAEFRGWMAEAHAVGAQQHLDPGRSAGRPR